MSITVTVTPPAGDPIVLDPIGAEGATGTNGWTPVIAIEYDGARAVHKIVDWGGGEGIHPPVGQYVAIDGAFVDDIADAADVRGPQGLQGRQGDPGLILTSGSIFTGDGAPNDADGVDNDIYIDNLTADLYQKQSGTWVLQTNIKGAKGDKGDQGDPGVAGVAGTHGATILIGTGVPASGVGANGDIYVEEITFTLYRKSGGAWSVVGVFKGASGNTIRVAAGAPSNGTGMDGDSYVDSANGDLYVRTAGTYTVVGNLKGPQGNDGAQGVQGVQGPSGASTLFGSGSPASGLGSNGDSYIDTVAFDLYTKSGGAWTNQGTLKGANGSDGIGNAIFTGPGAPGTIPTSIAGDIYINTTNGDVYQKVGISFGSPIMNMRGPQGDQGPQGLQGIQGSPGAAGTSILAGNGAPTNVIGNNGDLYINKTNGDFFGPKASGSWPTSTLNLKGPQGDQGIQGNPGAAGSNFLSGSGAPGAGVGVNGDTYLDTATGNLYGPKSGGAWGASVGSLKGAQGNQGIQGIQGNPGNPGTRGSTWSTGSGAPSSLVGRLNGDYYVNSTNGQIWQVVAGEWVDQGFSIRGPQGDQGVQGVRGIQGNTGPAGPSNMPQTSVSAAYTTVLSDAGKHIFHPAADTTARAWTIDHSLAYQIGDAISFINENGAGAITIGISGGTTPTLRLAGSTSTGSRSLAANGVATAVKVSASTWYINGTGLS